MDAWKNRNTFLKWNSGVCLIINWCKIYMICKIKAVVNLAMERCDKVPGLKHLLFITMQTDILLSLGGTKRLTSTKPSFPPRGMETSMSHLPWGGCFYRLVAFDPFCLETCKSARPKIEKNLEKETKRTYTESDAAGQLEPRQRKKRMFITTWA